MTGSWEPDPSGRHELRWRDGETWTDQVADGGVTAVDPMGQPGPVGPPPGAPAPPAPRRSRRALVIAAAVVAVVALGAAAFVLTTGGDDESADDTFERPAEDGGDGGDEDEGDDEAAEEDEGDEADEEAPAGGDLSALQTAALAELALDEVEPPAGEAFPTFTEGFQLGCAVAAAGLDEGSIVDLAFSDEGIDPDGELTFLAAAVTTFGDGDDIPLVLEAFPTAFPEDAADSACAFEGFAPEPTEPLEVGGEATTSFVDGGNDVDFAEHFLRVGDFLVEVQVSGGDAEARDELALDVLEQIHATLDAADIGEVDEVQRAADVAADAIALGDDLRACAFGPVATITDALPDAVDPAAFAGITDDDVAGQVFSGGEADITYCELFAAGAAIEGVRLDVAPGELDLEAYLDEEFGLGPDALDVSDSIDGGEAIAGCADGSCHAVLVGDGISFAVRLEGDAATTDDALAVLEALHPVALANLAADAASIT